MYYLEYEPDDGNPYIGVGILSGGLLAVTFVFAGNEQIGTTHYTIDGDNLSGFWTCFDEDCVGDLNFENLKRQRSPPQDVAGSA